MLERSGSPPMAGSIAAVIPAPHPRITVRDKLQQESIRRHSEPFALLKGKLREESIRNVIARPVKQAAAISKPCPGHLIS